jgi:parvulin-like peptidyl-prolyl isomerase
LSQGPNAGNGGYHDWTEWGSFAVSRELNEAIFSLPVQQLSGIIEDAEGLHIIRVLERSETHMIPFTEAQIDIKQKLVVEKRGKSVGEYINRLQKRTPIWTIYDQDEVTTRTAESSPARRDSANR